VEFWWLWGFGTLWFGGRGVFRADWEYGSRGKKEDLISCVLKRGSGRGMIRKMSTTQKDQTHRRTVRPVSHKVKKTS